MGEEAFDERTILADDGKGNPIATLIAIYERQREDEPEEGWPEGELSPRRVLLAVAGTIGNECSICRRRHGQEVQHAAE